MQSNMRPITNPDFNSIYEDMGKMLRSVAPASRPKYLDAYLLTGTGPQKLVAAMYKENPTLLNPKQAAQPPMGTVIGNMEKEAAAPEDRGLAELPVDNIDEDSFATGGIVAFDDGGSVYSGNRITDPNYANIIKGYQAALPGILAKYKRGVPLSESEKSAVKFLQQEGEVPATLESFFTAEPVVPAGLQYKEPPKVKPAASTITGKLSQEDIGAAGKDVAAEYKAEQGLGSIADKSIPAGSKDQGIGAVPAVPNVFGSFKGLQATQVKPITAEEMGVGERPTMAGVASLRKDAYREAGVDESVYQDRLDDVKKRLTGIEGDRKDAVANALVLAGLGIAGGKSQFALTNIAEGALPAFKEYKADLRELRDREDKVRESEFAVRDAQQKFRQTGADTDLKNLTEKETRFEKQKADLAVANKKLESDNATRKDDMTKLGVDVALKQAGLNLQRYSAETQRMIATRPDLTTAALNMLQGSEKFQSASGDEKLDMFKDTFFSLRGRTSGAGAKGYTYLAQLEKPFSDPANPLGRQYSKIAKEKGLEAAEKFKAETIAKQAKAAGIQYGDMGAGSDVIDFGSLPD